MVSVTLQHHIKWFGPTPLWAEQSTAGLRVVNSVAAAKPSILRFANDNFMDELLALIADSPRLIADYVVQPETWRKPMKSPGAIIRPSTESGVARLMNRIKAEADEKKLASAPSSIQKLLTSQSSMNVMPVDTPYQDQPIKLYHSTHQRYYLVSASLICDEIGMPDNVVQLTQQEKATFVVRRLVPPADTDLADPGPPNDQWQEHAFVQTPNGYIWQKIDHYEASATRQLILGEEQQPLFPVFYEGDCGCERQIHSGLIPVGKRETWLAAPSRQGTASVAVAASMDSNLDNRSMARTIFQSEIAEPWKAIINLAKFRSDSLSVNLPNFDTDTIQQSLDKAQAYRTLRDQIQTASWYILLDCANFLKERLPEVWAVLNNATPTIPLSEDEQRLVNLLHSTTASNVLRNKLTSTPSTYLKNDVKLNFQHAMVAVKAWEVQLEKVEKSFVRFEENGTALGIDPLWPDFLFPLADPEHHAPVPPSLSADETAGLETFEKDKAKVEALAELIDNLLPSEIVETSVDSTPSVRLDQKNAWFVVRCIYERPHCGPLFPPLVSAPTTMLEMASFFDSDAPVRPARIPMPVDITPAGLRKHKKNTAFILSDMLCGRVKKMKKYSFGDLVLSVLPWPFHKDLPDPGDTGPCGDEGGLNFGMICSLSIPIVTLCAFILLIIMVTLFDLFFRWIPYLMLCLPIPGLKSKPGPVSGD